MPKSKSKKFKVIRSTELTEALKGFVPVFGSEEDLRIVNRVLDLDYELPHVDNEIMRSGDKKKLTARMKKILHEEASIIHSLTRRSDMDF